MKKILSILIILITLSINLPVKAENNVSLDTNGNVINAHAGGIIIKDNTYYWYGEYRSPKPKNGEHWDSNQKVMMYKSKNLKNWTSCGVVLDLTNDKENWDLERPKIIYNKKNNNYVMWYHLEPQRHYIGGYAGVAISDNITGPYKMIGYSRLNKNIQPVNKERKKETNNEWAAGTAFRKYMPSGQQVRDLTLFVDDDKKAYLIYESEDDLSLQVAELNSDYTGTTGKYSRILIGQKNEAPTVFKRNNKYYLITSGLSGYNANPARSASSDNIFGPWTDLGNPVKSSNYDDRLTTYHSQPAFVFQKINSNALVMLADRWNTSGGGYKNLWKSSYVWLSIEFEDKKPKLVAN